MSYQEKTRFHGKWAKMKELADTSTSIAARTKEFPLGLIPWSQYAEHDLNKISKTIAETPIALFPIP